MTIAAATKVARRLASGPYGYSQGARTSAYARNGKLGVAGLAAKGDTDCSFSTGLVYVLGGLVDEDVLRGTFYTGNMASKLKASGMFTVTSVRGWSLAKLRKTLREGDSLVGPGHVVYCVEPGKVLSFENDERGKSTGGKLGDQTGREGRIRSLYSRSRGWAYLIRPISGTALQRQILAAHRAGKSADDALRRYRLRAPWDGPRWTTFMALWEGWDRGMQLVTNPLLVAIPPVGKHAFVVLGSTAAKMTRRLEAALPALKALTSSKIIVTGKPLRGGVSEAEWMQRWLIKEGINPARIVMERQASSTIGNARYSVPILAKLGITSYTLVSDASHLRRASVLFAARQMQLETASNKLLGLTPTVPLAVDDYAPAANKVAAPITASSRLIEADEVRTLLGL